MEIIRSVFKKTGRVRGQQLSSNKKTLKPLSGDQSINFLREIRRNLSLYLKEKPATPLDILVNVYVLFEQKVLTSEAIDKFSRSGLDYLLLNAYIWGKENVCLLVKFMRRIYLVIVDGKYTEFYNLSQSQSQQQQQQQQLSYQQVQKSYAKGITVPSKKIPHRLKVMFAIPISPSRSGVELPLDFQSISELVLSHNLYKS
jgi:hypothetical protein